MAPRSIVRLTLALLALVACSKSPPSATPDPAPIVVGSSSAASGGEIAPELVTFPSGASTLHGFVWRPAGEGPFPVVVFNHGSEELPGAKNGQAMFYVPHGFVLFVPHRRGQGRSKDVGRYIDSLPSDSQEFVDELVAQNDDVVAAIAWAAKQPYADPKRVYVAGCSLGGIESLLAAERAPGIVAAVDFAGAAITWSKNGALQERMKSAARNARVPVFFVQAENDFDTAPSLTLSALMKDAGKPVRVHVFPPNGTSHSDGHGFCMGGRDPAWGDEVLAFFREATASSAR